MRQQFWFRNERGAIMLIAVFFAIFLVGMLLLAIAAGEAVLFRENLQDAADSAALSAAVTQARIMNVLVLINIVMSILLSVLVALKLIEGIAIVGIAIAAGLAWFTGGSSLAAIPPLNGLRSTMQGMYEQVEPSVFGALSTLKNVGDQLAKIAPQAAEAGSQADIADNRRVVNAGFVSITPQSLPVSDDSYEMLCGKAGGMAIDIANIPLGVVPPIAALMGLLRSPMEMLASSLSQWFCGDGENRMPDLSQTIDVGYPSTKESEDCRNDTSVTNYFGSDTSDEPPPTTLMCDKAEAQRIAAQPATRGDCRPSQQDCSPTGECLPDQQDCGPSGAYSQVSDQARSQCDPSKAPNPLATRYQRQDMRVLYTWNGKAWLRGEPELVRSVLVEQDPKVQNSPPCGAADLNPVVAPGYNVAARPANDPSVNLPVCNSEKAPEVPTEPTELENLHSGTNPSTVTVEYQQVERIFGCVKHEKQPVDIVEGKQAADVDGNDKSPKRVNDVKLGSEVFQTRAVMFGNLEQKEAVRLVRLSLWGKPAPDNPLEGLRKYGGFSVAQAEYYFDQVGSVDEHEDWMWSMNWRARLKRVAMPESDEDSTALYDDCQATVGGSECDRVLNLIEDWNDLLVH